MTLQNAINKAVSWLDFKSGAFRSRIQAAAGLTANWVATLPNWGGRVMVQRQINVIAHTFTVGQSIFLSQTGVWALARNNDQATLGQYLILEVFDVDNFSIAIPGEIVSGYTGLTPGLFYHTSPTVAGALVSVAATEQQPADGYAANSMGQAINATQLIASYTVPYQVF